METKTHISQDMYIYIYDNKQQNTMVETTMAHNHGKCENNEKDSHFRFVDNKLSYTYIISITKLEWTIGHIS